MTTPRYRVEGPRISLDIGRFQLLEDTTHLALTSGTFSVSLMVWERPMIARSDVSANYCFSNGDLIQRTGDTKYCDSLSLALPCVSYTLLQEVESPISKSEFHSSHQYLRSCTHKEEGDAFISGSVRVQIPHAACKYCCTSLHHVLVTEASRIGSSVMRTTDRGQSSVNCRSDVRPSKVPRAWDWYAGLFFACSP